MKNDFEGVDIPHVLKPERGDITARRVAKALERLDEVDGEASHGAVDAFAIAVINAIAAGHSEPQKLAQSAKVVLSVDYTHYCA